jgi:hypothetical protein
MAKRILVLVLVFLMVCAVTATAKEIDYIQFFNIELNLLHLIILGDVVDMGSGVIVDFNTGDFLWHAGARIQYLAGIGVAGEAGVGYIISGTYNTAADYVQVIPIRTWTVGNIQYTEYERTEGKCPAAWLHVVEAGVKPHYLYIEGYDWEQTFSDIIIYAGYRYASFYSEIITIQEIELQAHVLVGFTGRHYYDPWTTTNDFGRIAFGGEIGIKWNLMHVNLAYYDQYFYMDFALRLPFTIMW